MKKLVFFLLFTLLLPACANSPTDKSIDDKANLQMTVQTFHRDMRWRRWEMAAMLVIPEERQEFLGRYEELGDDFHIVELELKSVSPGDKKALVELEQRSYKEPNMTVKKERLIEVWEMRDNAWLLADRLPKDEFKEKIKAEQAKQAEKAEPEKDTAEAETPREDDP